MSVMRLETEAAVRIRAFADVKTVVGGNVDGLACDRLSDHGDPSFISGGDAVRPAGRAAGNEWHRTVII